MLKAGTDVPGLSELALTEIRGIGHCSSCFIGLLADSVSLPVPIALYTFKEMSLPPVVTFNLPFKFFLEIRRKAHKKSATHFYHAVTRYSPKRKDKSLNAYKQTGEKGKSYNS